MLMFRSPITRVPSNLDAVIDDVYKLLQRCEPTEDEYEVLLTKLERLEKLKNAARSKRTSRDVVVTGLFNLGCVVAIVAYEQRHVMTSKALGIIQKMI